MKKTSELIISFVRHVVLAIACVLVTLTFFLLAESFGVEDVDLGCDFVDEITAGLIGFLPSLLYSQLFLHSVFVGKRIQWRSAAFALAALVWYLVCFACDNQLHSIANALSVYFSHRTLFCVSVCFATICSSFVCIVLRADNYLRWGVASIILVVIGFLCFDHSCADKASFHSLDDCYRQGDDRKRVCIVKQQQPTSAGLKLSARDMLNDFACSAELCADDGGIDIPFLSSEKNQVMDELLNQPQVPADYGETMMTLYRDKSQDVLTRDFAVQHIGLYAQALSRRGNYNTESEDARNCRAALFDAASETHAIVAAAAFRALADMSVFDSRVDARRLDLLLASCAADASATPAARAMAVQLCGERRIAASRPALEKAVSDPAAGEVVRRSAKYALSLIDGGEVMR